MQYGPPYRRPPAQTPARAVLAHTDTCVTAGNESSRRSSEQLPQPLRGSRRVLRLKLRVNLLPPEASALMRTAPVAVGAAHVAFRDLRLDDAPSRVGDHPGDAVLLHLISSMVELENSNVGLAAVHAGVADEVVGDVLPEPGPLCLAPLVDPRLVHFGVRSVPGPAAIATTPLSAVLGPAAALKVLQRLRLATCGTCLHSPKIEGRSDIFDLVGRVRLERTTRSLKGSCSAS